RATIGDVADHIEHIIRIAGADHVGLGSDFDGIESTPIGLESVETYPALLAELARRGHSDDVLRKITGLNMLRVMRAVEATAAKLQKETRPDDTRIEESGAPAPSPAK
ncbi:MAG TPA: membrane dipeptidase, partial [Thermoanaerobaculia bacterium]